MSQLIDNFPKWADSDGAIFKALYTGHSASFAWLTNYALLDLDYFGNHSGSKTAAPLIDKFVATHTGTTPLALTSAEMEKLANVIAMRFGKKWTQLWAIMVEEYNPIENYSMTQTETPNITKKYSVSADYLVTDTTKVNSDLSVTTSNEGSNDVYGFNSQVASPQSNNYGSATTQTQGDDDNNFSTSTHEQTGYTQDQETGTRTLTRSGNIGVTTSQQMIESEIALWQWNFYKQVYEDVDQVLALRIYD